VSFCAASLSFVSATLFEVEVPFWLVFSGTLCVYCLQRWYKFFVLHDITKQHKEVWMVNHRMIYLIQIVLSGCVFLYLIIPSLFDLSPLTLFLIIGGLICVFYVVRIGKKNLRETPYLKLFLVASVYCLMTSIIPYPQIVNLDDLLNFLPFFGLLFLYVLGITLMFDIRDVLIDKPETQTIPMIIGVKNSFYLSSCLSVLSLLGLLLYLNTPTFWSLVVLGIHFGVYFVSKRKKNNEFIVSFLFEGLLALTGWVVYLAK
jgi:hypothetical protein